MDNVLQNGGKTDTPAKAGQPDALERAGAAVARMSIASAAEKRSYDHVRQSVLALAILAAFLGAVTAALVPNQGVVHLGFAFVTALVLGLGPFLTQRFMSQAQATRWVEIRASAEALKREVYKRATLCKPYDGDKKAANQALIDEKEAIENSLGDYDESGSEDTRLPKVEIDAKTYIETRVENQLNWMRRRAKQHSTTAKRLRTAEMAVAAVGIVLTAGAAAVGEATSTAYLTPFIGVVTTVSTALVAHIEAGRYQFIAAAYRITAKRLENTLGRFDPEADPLPPFVEKCEAILAEENSAWMAKHVRA